MSTQISANSLIWSFIAYDLDLNIMCLLNNADYNLVFYSFDNFNLFPPFFD